MLTVKIEALAPSPRLLRLSVLVALFLLLAQFVVGMFVNLYIAIPAGHPGSSGSYVTGAVPGLAWAISTGAPALAIHTALGIVLGIVSLALLGIAIASRERPVVVASAVALLATVGAGLGGVGFLNYAVDKTTFLMAVGFSVAVGAYVAALFAIPHPGWTGALERDPARARG